MSQVEEHLIRMTHRHAPTINRILGTILDTEDVELGIQLPHGLSAEELNSYGVFASLTRMWTNAGRVVVTTDATTQALLGVTPHGPLSHTDWVSPWGTHAILLDPPIPHLGTSIPLVLLGYGPCDRGRQTHFAVCISESLDVVSYLCSETDTDLFAASNGWPESLRRAYRITVGLNRLIQGAPSASRPGQPATRAAEVVDRGVSKKTQERSVLVRRLFVVDPTIAEACRAAVRKGGVHAPALRHLVRGHWRNQACGPKHQDHQRIWIQPHWRGALRDIMLPVEVRVQ